TPTTTGVVEYKTLEHILGLGNARVQNGMGLVEELLAAVGDEPATTEEDGVYQSYTHIIGVSWFHQITPADWWWDPIVFKMTDLGALSYYLGIESEVVIWMMEEALLGSSSSLSIESHVK
ncbi:hypothetical protein ACJX0J_017251, partial [Zea mays]